MRAVVLVLLLSGCQTTDTTSTPPPAGSCPLFSIHDFREPMQWTELDQWTLERAINHCEVRGLCLKYLNIYSDNRYRAYCMINRAVEEVGFAP